MTVSTNTRWSLVQAAKGDTPQARAALSDLCAIYYAPVHGFVRRWVVDGEEARDLTQSFFARLLEGQGLLGAEQMRGRFRSYLFGAVKHFIAEYRRNASTVKRGGQATALPADEALELIDEHTPAPDAEFDRAWACAVLDRVLALLGDEMAKAGKAPIFNHLKPWLAGSAGHGDTAAAAATLGVSETAVRVLVSRLRQRMRQLLRDELAQTLSDGGDVDAEMRFLADALR